MENLNDNGFSSALWFYKQGFPVFPAKRDLTTIKKLREQFKNGLILEPAKLMADFEKEYSTKPEAWCVFLDGWFVCLDAENDTVLNYLKKEFPTARIEKGSKGGHIFLRLEDKKVAKRIQFYSSSECSDETLSLEVLSDWSCVVAGSKHRSKEIIYSIIKNGDVPLIKYESLKRILKHAVADCGLFTKLDKPTYTPHNQSGKPSFFDLGFKPGLQSCQLPGHKNGDSHPSFSVMADGRMANCFSVHGGMDTIKFVMLRDGVNFSKACEILHIEPTKTSIQESAIAGFFQNKNPQNPQESAIMIFYDGNPQEPAKPATEPAIRNPPLGGADSAVGRNIYISSLEGMKGFITEKKEWVCPNAVPESSICMLAAKRASHKTFFALHLGLSVASGSPNVLGNPTAPKSVLYLDYENGDYELSRRSLGILKSLPDDKQQIAQNNFHSVIYPRLNLDSDEDGEEKLDALLTALKPKLVICDVMRRMTSGEENSSETSNAILGSLQRAVKKHGCSFLLLHHMRKGDKSGVIDDELDEIRGSSDIVASVAVVLKLARFGQTDKFIVKQLKNRYAPERNPIQVHIEGTAPEAIRFVNDGEISDAAAIENALARAIHEWLVCERKFSFQTKEVKARFVGAPPKSSERSVEEGITILVQLEKIRRTEKKGCYELVLPNKQTDIMQAYGPVGAQV